MIKIPKKQSFNSSLKPLLRLFFFPSLYIFLPLFLRAQLKIRSFWLIFVFYLANAVIAAYFLKKIRDSRHRLQLKLDNIQEKINILDDEFAHESEINLALRRKVLRYGRLKSVIGQINKELSLDEMSEQLVASALTLVAGGRGVSALYLLDDKNQEISLFKSAKEDKDLVIEAKGGDIFDAWVLRQATPLLVEDTKKDFRFDSAALGSARQRNFSSLISVPLIVEQNFLGILRLDSANPGEYSQDDLRFLVALGDIGAVALENSQLYQRTLDLAIHDGLTALYTKGYFMQRLMEECRGALRHKTRLALFMLDVDHFKEYNDNFGHTAGDMLLKRLSAIISQFLQATSRLICRFGGEEFCALLAVDKEEALSLAEALRSRIEKEKMLLRRKETGVTASIGIAFFPGEAGSEDELIFQADQAMYAAKNQGRNRVVAAKG